MSVGQPTIETEYSLDDGSEDLRTEFDEEFDEGFDVDEFDAVKLHTETGCSDPGTVPYCC